MNTQERRDELVRVNDQNTEERQKYDRDYEDPDEDNEQHVYIVLESPTPKRGEGEMKNEGGNIKYSTTNTQQPISCNIHSLNSANYRQYIIIVLMHRAHST